MTRPKPKDQPGEPGTRRAEPREARADDEMFYSRQFSPEELALVAVFVTDPTLDDELWLQRVLNHRLFHFLDETPGDEPLELATLVKVAEALGAGTARVARLLRDRRALSRTGADTLSEALALALTAISQELGREL